MDSDQSGQESVPVNDAKPVWEDFGDDAALRPLACPANNQDCNLSGSGFNGVLCCASAREAVRNSRFRIVSGKPRFRQQSWIVLLIVVIGL